MTGTVGTPPASTSCPCTTTSRTSTAPRREDATESGRFSPPAFILPFMYLLCALGIFHPTYLWRPRTLVANGWLIFDRETSSLSTRRTFVQGHRITLASRPQTSLVVVDQHALFTPKNVQCKQSKRKTKPLSGSASTPKLPRYFRYGCCVWCFFWAPYLVCRHSVEGAPRPAHG